MSEFQDGEWLQSNTDPTFLIQVEATSDDGNVLVISSGVHINTSERYLSNTYRRVGNRP